jgi:DHA1 family bicyclomycin/chloramphenicol resistance-like MFS transporter
MAFFISLGVGQLIYGPLSTWLVLRHPLYTSGLVLFGAGGVGCALAHIQTLVVLRFIKAWGPSADMVIPAVVQ